jgi:hypothetical protein
MPVRSLITVPRDGFAAESNASLRVHSLKNPAPSKQAAREPALV